MRYLYKSDIIRLAKPLVKSGHLVYFLIQDTEIIHVGISHDNNFLAAHKDLLFNKTFVLKAKTQDKAQELYNRYSGLQNNFVEETKPLQKNIVIKPKVIPKLQKIIVKQQDTIPELHKNIVKDTPPLQKDFVIPLSESEYKNVKVSEDQYIKKGNGYVFMLNGNSYYTDKKAISIDGEDIQFTGAFGKCIYVNPLPFYSNNL